MQQFIGCDAHKKFSVFVAVNSPGAYPVFPHALTNFPSFEYLTALLLPFTSWPSATKMSPFAATATALGDVK
jgi:hypothetical protein